MVAASLAAPIGAQHHPPRALRGASGSSAPGNRLPQPTTQPAVVHATAGNCPVHAAGNCPRATYRRVLPPARLPLGQPTCRACCHATCRQDLPAAHTTVHTAEELPQKSYRRHAYRRVTYRRGILPCSGSRAQRAGDSDVGANDKGAGDDPGDRVDAH